MILEIGISVSNPTVFIISSQTKFRISDIKINC